MENVILLLYIGLPIGLGLFIWASKGSATNKKRTSFLYILGGNILIFLFLGSLTLLPLESYFRWGRDTTDSFGLSKVTQRWFSRHYQSNSLGMRDDREYPLKVAPGKKRITFIGDSFTAGHGIKNPEDRFANRIRKSLENSEVHILARNGLDTGAQAKLIFTTLSKGYEVQRVVLAYVLNDISDLAPDWQSNLKGIYSGKERQNTFIKYSYFANFLYYRIKSMMNPDIANYFGFVKKTYADKRLWAIQQKRLAGIKEGVEKSGGKLLVVTFPFLHQIGKNYEYTEIHAQLNEFWENLGVPHLDLYEAYAQYPPKKLVVNSGDAHPNEFAHKIAAEKILEFIQDN